MDHANTTGLDQRLPNGTRCPVSVPSDSCPDGTQGTAATSPAASREWTGRNSSTGCNHVYTDSGISTSGSELGSCPAEIDGHACTILPPKQSKEVPASFASSQTSHPNGSREATPIAICGMAMRLPGGIHTADEFWDLLIQGRDARSPIPSSRFNVDGFGDSLGGQESIQTKFGYFLTDDLSQLDTSFFSMSRKELEKCDPQQRLLLEVARECLEDAGEVNYRGRQIGCYVGTYGEDWLQMSSKETQHSGNYMMTGSADFFIANRVSYEYDLRGPSMVVKTGCSAALVALHEACRALNSGDAVAAVVAGTNLLLGPATFAAMTAEGALSPEGSCKTFDVRADGFARAEGISAVYVKRLSDAIRDGNPIRAVIRATGNNTDGKSQGILVPRAEAQEELMRRVYAEAGLDPSETDFIECHGTGTAAGDPIEATAVGNVFGSHPVYIGSVKPNVGHGEGSAGITSLIKAVLALEHRTYPPNIKFQIPNPKIPFREKKLTVPTEAVPFSENRAERISINSFGIGGSNAHVVVDASPLRDNSGTDDEAAPQPSLIVLSANTLPSLEKEMKLYDECIARNPLATVDVAYTRALRRESLPYRAFLVSQGGLTIERSACSKSPFKKSEHRVNMVFTGQGSQWAGMGRELLLSNALFRRDIESMDEILQTLKHPPTWRIKDELLKLGDKSQLNRAEIAQPLCTALQIALFHQFLRLEVAPAAVVGHSSGEIAAAYAAGYITLKFALAAAFYRGYVTVDGGKNGAMAAVGLGPEEISEFLTDGVVLACANSPQSVTISGDREKVEQVIVSIARRKPPIFARVLKVDMAYHSHHMLSLGSKYLQLLREEPPNFEALPPRPRSLFVSSVTGKLMEDSSEFGPEYWVSNLVSPVLFSSAVPALISANPSSDVFLEIGPHSTLAGPLRQIASSLSLPINYVPSQKRHHDCSASLLSAFGRLYQENININLRALFSSGKTVPGLPPYPWDHSGPSFWCESRLSKAWRTRQYPHHCLLGLRSTESPDSAPVWRNVIHVEDLPWLPDHKVGHDIVFPFAAYVLMAGEAVRQVENAYLSSAYRLHHVIAHSALVIQDSEPVEVVTTLYRKRLTDSDGSSWFQFRVSSYNGTAWTRHCEGEVLHLDSHLKPASTGPPTCDWHFETLPRHISPLAFYNSMSQVGYTWGPEFQMLADMSSSTTAPLANARLMIHDKKDPLTSLTFHPGPIDACLQLFLYAAAEGLCRRLDRLYMPTNIEDILVLPSAAGPEMVARAWIGKDNTGASRVQCCSEGNLAVEMSGIQLKPLNDDSLSSDSTIDAHAAARLHWLPHFDFVDHSALLGPPKFKKEETKMQQEMMLLYILEEARKIADVQPCEPHFAQLRNWMKEEIASAKAGHFPLVEDPASLIMLSPGERQAMMETHYQTLLKGKRYAFTLGSKRIFEKAAEIFTGAASTLEILKEGDILARIYDAQTFDFGKFVLLLAHSRPNLRILEVGAGTGGTTEIILRDLLQGQLAPLYSTYAFTDVSSGFFPKAKERFAHVPNMEYKVFDIARSPFEQGFGEHEERYDLIVASYVVHATPCIRESLANMRALLKPNGFVVLGELCPNLRLASYAFGHFAGWWQGAADGRPSDPNVTVERWDKELKASGFVGAETVVYDEAAPYHNSCAIVSRPLVDRTCPQKRATVMCENVRSPMTDKLIGFMEQSGWKVTACQLGMVPPPEQDIICCLDIEGNFSRSMDERRFADLKALMKNAASQNRKVLWLTSLVQLKCSLDPQPAQFIGLARTLRTELSVQLFTLEIDLAERLFQETVLRVFRNIQTQDDSGTLAPDMEFAVDNGVVCVQRCHPFSLADELHGVPEAKEETSADKILRVAKIGSIDSLHWQDIDLLASGPGPSLRENEVEIETRAIGLNYRDVLLAMGIIPSHGSISLGFEASGVARRVGSAVRWISPGDRVLTLAEGCLATSIVVSDDLVQRIPNGMTFEEAAAVPVCFATALYSLVDIGRLRSHQSVLIHSACGGLGLAAIQVCKMIGAEIFATVGNSKKADYLVERMGIPRSHIFHSRDSLFYTGLMRETSGRGVDLVLNSLAGELLHESWKCVAKFGTMVELGQRDLRGSGQLNMLPFLDNRAYHGVDINQLRRERPKRIKELLAQFIDLYDQSLLKPTQQSSIFSAQNVMQAFRYLQQGDHIGKAVVTMPLPSERGLIVSSPQPRSIRFDADGAYLMVGGVGGLGRSIATWMVERGARSLIFLSRSAGLSNESKALYCELESMGCSVLSTPGSVDNIDIVQQAIHRSRKPIKGVIQLAMVLKDAPFMDMQWPDWTAAVSPKVQGTWNLHTALLPHNLDFFWMASSIVTAVDTPGQSNYNAANTFLEAFCQYRHALGLPASVLNICPISDVGFVTKNPQAERNLRVWGLHFLREREFLDFLELSLLEGRPQESSRGSCLGAPPTAWTNKSQILMGLRSRQPLDDPNNKTSWRRNRRMGAYHNIRDGATITESEKSTALKDFLDQAADKDAGKELLKQKSTINFLIHETGRKICDLMLKPEESLDPNLTLAQIGLDSLMAIELRKWFKGALRLDLSVLEIMAAGSLVQLSELITVELTKKMHGEGEKK